MRTGTAPIVSHTHILGAVPDRAAHDGCALTPGASAGPSFFPNSRRDRLVGSIGSRIRPDSEPSRRCFGGRARRDQRRDRATRRDENAGRPARNGVVVTPRSDGTTRHHRCSRSRRRSGAACRRDPFARRRSNRRIRTLRIRPRLLSSSLSVYGNNTSQYHHSSKPFWEWGAELSRYRYILVADEKRTEEREAIGCTSTDESPVKRVETESAKTQRLAVPTYDTEMESA